MNCNSVFLTAVETKEQDYNPQPKVFLPGTLGIFFGFRLNTSVQKACTFAKPLSIKKIFDNILLCIYMLGTTMIWFRIILPQIQPLNSLEKYLRNDFNNFYSNQQEPFQLTLYRTINSDESTKEFYISSPCELGLLMNEEFVKYNISPVNPPDIDLLVFVSGSVYELEFNF